jgi:cytidylate kinase
MIIAIDGPAGTGKSTVARLAGQRLGFYYLDTGAMYRAVTWYALTHHVPLDDAEALGAAARAIDIRFDWVTCCGSYSYRVYVDEAAAEKPVQPAVESNLKAGLQDQHPATGTEVTQAIRSAEVSERVSQVSAFAPVREALLAKQRAYARVRDVILEGRDTATVVFPEAELKIFLDASPEIRAERRAKQLKIADPKKLAALAKQIAERDQRDRERSLAPLKPAPDSIIIDTSEQNVTQVVKRIVALACEHGAKLPQAV